MNRWYVVHTHARAEEQAAAHLRRQGFSVFLPRMERTLRHARKAVTRAVALFPRYLFVSLDPETRRWRPVLSTVGVAGLVLQGGLPAPVPDGVIDEIRARQDGRGLVAPPLPPVGQQVEMTAGPLAGIQALFAGADADRVTVLLSLLGRQLPVRLTLADIAA